MNQMLNTQALIAGLLTGSLLFGLAGCAGSTPRGNDTAAGVPSSLGSSRSLTDLDGASHEILDGKSTTVLVFWATWCVPCRRELPDLAVAHAAHGESAQFFGVLAGEAKHVDEQAARKLLSKAGVRYPQLRDFDGSLAQTFGVKGTPTVIVLGPDGQTRYHGHSLPESWAGLLDK